MSDITKLLLINVIKVEQKGEQFVLKRVKYSEMVKIIARLIGLNPSNHR